jgi:aerobic carbon-monoxide dehydrogenase large subunit
MIGARTRRTEDPRLIRGQGCYVDDVRVPGVAHMAVLRSTWPHARLAAIVTERAAQLPGVLAVLTFVDVAAHVGTLPNPAEAVPVPDAVRTAGTTVVRDHRRTLLADGIVRYVGEPIAVVLATDAAVAESALEAIDVEYEPLPVITTIEQALAPGAPVIHPDWGDNVAARVRVTRGDVDATLAAAPVRIRESFHVGRHTGMPIETRGAIARFDAERHRLDVWASGQSAHRLRDVLCATLGLSPDEVHVTVPDVGGAFGQKGASYPEEILVAHLARRLGRPVKWIETRHEHFLGSTHSRDQRHEVEVGATRDGRILAIRDRIVIDSGAANPRGIVLPYNTVAHLLGPYRVAEFDLETTSVVTNKVPLSPTRGTGRPEATFVMTRVLDLVARATGLDGVEVRLRNLVPPEAMPYAVGMLYRDGVPLVYDNGDYPEALRRALKLIDHDRFRAEQPALRTAGMHRGLGTACFIEGTGFGDGEWARVRVEPSGLVVVASGATSQGQSHATTLAQICGSVLGVPLDAIEVRGGDTDQIRQGSGTFASRTIVAAGNAVAEAARELRGRLLAAAAPRLGVAESALDLRDGVVIAPDGASLTIAHLASAAARSDSAGDVAAPGAAGGTALDLTARAAAGTTPFDVTAHFAPETVTFSYGAHAAIVEVDVETCAVRVVRYAAVDDCGLPVNPGVVEGQLMGGIMTGIGGALGENLVYDADGQLLTASFMDYLMPTAGLAPEPALEAMITESPRNPLGVRGVGEGGVIAPMAAIANAVEDALGEYGVRITETPITAAGLFELLKRSRGARE